MKNLGFDIPLSICKLHISDFFNNLGLRSDYFRGPPIISQWGKIMYLSYASDLFESFRIMINKAIIDDPVAILHE